LASLALKKQETQELAAIEQEIAATERTEA
jgi:hypothetical protein